MKPKREDIANLAYQFYVEDGRPEGRSDEFWQRAEEFLSHPENHSDQNVLSVPSEPELTRALDEKSRELDTDLPSDTHTGEDAVDQKVELAVDRNEKRQDLKTLQHALAHLEGIEGIDPQTAEGRVVIRFDARRTNPAAIHEAILNRGYQPSAVPQR